MTYETFVEIINMPSVLVIIFMVVFVLWLVIAGLMQRLLK